MTGRTALLIVDMQNSFCRPEGVMSSLIGAIDGIEGVVAAQKAFVAEARSNDVPIVHVRQVFQPSHADAGVTFRRRVPQAAERGALVRGTWDAAIIDELAPAPDDVVVDKTRFDGFLATPLTQVLHNMGVERLLIGGVLTDICVESTTRSAFQHDFTNVLLTDCCGSATAVRHRRALDAMREGRFAEPRTSAEATAYLTG